MIANFQRPGAVIIGNLGFMIDLMREYGEAKISTTPADENLFNVRASPQLSILNEKRFHSSVAKSLYLSKRTRPDILKLVAFLTTRYNNLQKMTDENFIREWDILPVQLISI